MISCEQPLVYNRCKKKLETQGTMQPWTWSHSQKHALLNDIIWHGLTEAVFLATQEPDGLARSDERRPDGVTLILWESGKCLAWDNAAIDTLAESYRTRSAGAAVAATEIAAHREN